MNGYNFTERTRHVLTLAREQAASLGHEYIGAEHILLGLIAEGEGVAAVVLQNLGVDLERLAQTTIASLKKGREEISGRDLPYAARAKKVIELSMSEAMQLHHSYVGTEHLLLGLLREGKGIAAQMLASVGVTTENARSETLRILGTEIETRREASPPVAPPEGVRPSQIHIALRYPNGATRSGTFGTAGEALAYINEFG